MKKIFIYVLFITISNNLFSQYKEGFVFMGNNKFLVNDYIYNDSKFIITSIGENKMTFEYENIDSIYIKSINKEDKDFLEQKNVNTRFDKIVIDGTPYTPENREYSLNKNISLNGIEFNVIETPDRSSDEIFSAIKLWHSEQVQNSYGKTDENYIDEEKKIFSNSFFHEFLFINAYKKNGKPDNNSICCYAKAKLTLTVQVKDGRFRYKVDVGKLKGERKYAQYVGYYYPKGHDKFLSEIYLTSKSKVDGNWTLNFRENTIKEIIKIEKLISDGIVSYLDKVVVDDDW